MNEEHQKEIWESLEAARISSHTTETTFSKLRDVANSIGDEEAFLSECDTMEDHYFNKYFHDDPSAKLKNGKWLKKKLPKSYSSAKSVLRSALKWGVDIGQKGKTDLETEYGSIKKAATSSGPIVDPATVGERLLGEAVKYINARVPIRDLGLIKGIARDALDRWEEVM